ncbi:hypothetical protein J421_4684 (plasmid) [Gemmatirosa kalamazoonensis]|uniref:Uncharacterized protein n=1 Tax=Gemmatirosa kalamazoonensis TaxID=861299 RepID=W0RMF4_9BACT|nr:hypothetical protein [Gemmatirosa kalamazoonensis]AHG92152.1 hypothetical protein J421_4617 [Gemmatirosa kalamazoonensis]AHG92219.1 hypothetical protein J421_4684 [Gemmatirosa kalamazoonensis]
MPAVPAPATRWARALVALRRWWAEHVGWGPAECRCVAPTRESWGYRDGAFVGRCLDCGGSIPRQPTDRGAA